MTVRNTQERRFRRRRRIRSKIKGTAERPRISVFRSNRGVSAQLIDDTSGRTLAAVAWSEEALKDLAKSEQVEKAGQLFAERAKAAGVESAVFDRGGYLYHGVVKNFAQSMRASGLTF